MDEDQSAARAPATRRKRRRGEATDDSSVQEAGPSGSARAGPRRRLENDAVANGRAPSSEVIDIEDDEEPVASRGGNTRGRTSRSEVIVIEDD